MFKKSLYAAVWRWHFYAGIIFAPFIVILALSGSIYLFKDEIEAYQYHDLFYVNQSTDAPMSLGRQYNAVKSAYPGYRVASIQFERSERRTTEFALSSGTHPPDSHPESSHPSDSHSSENHQVQHAPRSARASATPENISVFVNPYTGEIQGQLNNELRIMPVFKKVHSELLIGGTIANRWVELAACWTLILTLTGLHLWWPTGRFSIWGTFLPRLERRGRALWRELHAVTAVWTSVILIILILSGLSWANVMGQQYRSLGKLSEKISGSAKDSMYPHYASRFGPKPNSDMTMKDVATVPWAAEELPAPTSAKPTPKPLTLDAVQQVAVDKQLVKPYAIFLPGDRAGVFTLATLARNPVNEATINVDQYSGKLITDYSFQDYGWLGKTISLGIAFHEGRLFGLPNQLVNFLVAWGTIFIAVTGWIMRLKRKTKGLLGTPGAPANQNASKFLVVCSIIMGLLFPPLGLSLIAVYLIEKLVIRNIPPLKNYFAL